MAGKKRRLNPNRKAKYTNYRSRRTDEVNKINRAVQRIYNLVMARIKAKKDRPSKQLLKVSIKENVLSGMKNKDLGRFLTKDMLDGWAGIKVNP